MKAGMNVGTTATGKDYDDLSAHQL